MAVEIENELTLSDYLSIARRRWLQILITFLVFSVSATIIIFNMSPRYDAEGFIAIESPAISKALIGDELDKATAAKYVDEHLDKVKQKILSRENLVRLNEKYDLFPALTKPSYVAGAIEKSIWIDTDKRSSNGADWGPQVTVGFTVGFEYSDPDTTYKTINDIIAQLLDQNVKDRTRRATETASFLTSELSKLQGELDTVEDDVAAYKQKHSNSLPEHHQLHMATLDQFRSTLKSLDMDSQSAQEELRYLDVELMTAKAAINNAGGAEIEAVSKLDMARAELNRSMVLYKDTHPTIRALKRKLALLEKENLKPVTAKPKKVDVAGELAIAKIQSQIEAAKARLGAISQEKRAARAQAKRVKNQIVNIPLVERGLATLLRDYENAKRKYDDVKAKQVNAKVAESLELNNKAERFVLLVSPEYPQYNKNMRKAKAIPLGLMASLGLGFGLAFLLEILDKRVRGQNALMSVINTKPLVVIPYINTQAELNHKKNLIRLFSISVAILACLLIALAITHFFITPLGSLFVLET